MNTVSFYYIMVLPTTTDVMEAEKHLKNLFSITIMPTPREISSGCGLAIRFLDAAEEELILYCRTVASNGTLYKLYTHRIDGRHPIEALT